MERSGARVNNTISLEKKEPAPCPRLITGRELAGWEKYFTDESRCHGWAEALVFPRTEEELCAAVAEAVRNDWVITVSGARTGITAGAVPEGGLVISLERMNRVLGLRRLGDGRPAIRCQAGMSLQELQDSLRASRFVDAAEWDQKSRELLEELKQEPVFFPPDPTETTATLGGLAACNASGAHTFRYGPTRSYVNGLSLVLANGERLRLRRGEATAGEDGTFILQNAEGRKREVRIPAYSLPATKNAAGYYTDSRLDLIDLFIGSEGTLGIIAEVELILLPRPSLASANLAFLESEGAALELVERLREDREKLAVEAIEYFDSRSLDFLRGRREKLGAASGVPECLPVPGGCAIYLDLAADTEAGLAAALERLREHLLGAEGDPAKCWSAQETDERERLRVFRHALPEAINQRIAAVQRNYPAVAKLGTDMAVPDQKLREVIDLYRAELEAAALEYVIFGHIGDNHLHINILPETPEQYQTGRRLYLEFARQVVAMGGSPAAEHGIGKLKKEFLELLLGVQGVEEMRRLKCEFDPDLRLGKGTLFE